MVIGFGLATEAAITVPAPIQCAANLIGGGAQQSSTVRVIFLLNTHGFVELVTSIPFFTSFNALALGNR